MNLGRFLTVGCGERQELIEKAINLLHNQRKHKRGVKKHKINRV